MIEQFVISSVTFGRMAAGIINRPYETYRHIVDRANLQELGIIGLITWIYFIVASLVKTSLFRPFLLTHQLVVLMTATILTYCVAVGLFWLTGMLLGAKGNLRGFAVGWGYTLLPTLGWFLMTSLLYVLIPPPRTTSIQGVIFSMVYLLFTIILLFWKVTLSYLALRFGLRLDLMKILLMSLIVLPILGLYSLGMYRLGIFRIPFI